MNTLRINNKRIGKFTNYVTDRTYIVGGSLIEFPEVEGFDRLDNFFKVQKIKDVNYVRRAVVENIKKVERVWQFWFSIFIFKDNGKVEIEPFTVEPITGTSIYLDEVLNKELKKHSDKLDAEGTKYLIGWVAIPSEKVVIDEKAENDFLKIFKSKGFMDLSKYESFMMMKKLESV